MSANGNNLVRPVVSKWLVLLTVIVGTFLGRLDQTIVNLALPKIIDEFGITVNTAGWIATAYILANAVFVPIWGKLGDTIGRKKVYIIGFLVFIFGSVLAGFSWNFNSMIVFRIIQAIASSADYPTAMAILAVTFSQGKERAQALGLWSASFAAAAVLGPLVGGPLIDNFGWRSIFLMNLPVGAVGLVMAMLFIHESTSERKTLKFDWLGAMLLGGALASLVLVLDKGLEWGWFSLNSLMTYASVIIFTVWFIVVERKHPEPIIDFKFFKISTFNHALINNFIVFMGLMGGMFLVPVFVQTYLGYDATQTGYLFIPMVMAMMIGSPLGGALSDKISARTIIFISTLGAAFGLYLFSRLDPRSTALDVIIPMAFMAFWMGFGMAQRTNIIASSVPVHEVGIASSILALARNIAGAFGIAVFGTILHNSTETNIVNVSKLSSIHVIDSLQYQTALQLMILKAQIEAYRTVFIWVAIVILIGALLALRIKVSKEDVSDVEIFVE